MNSNVPAPAGATPQLTFRAVLLAIVLAVVLSAANAYLGLFAGLTVATAIPAAVVSMGVLRLLGGGTILENNIVQTGASAGSSIAAGVIFTIPALIILGYWDSFEYSWVLAIAGLGGLLGVLFSVPLRRSMIVEEPLPFPEGKAAAEVLKAGENPGPGLKLLGFSAAIGAVLKLAAYSGMRVIPDTAAGAGFFGKYLGYLGTNLSPALLGVGYIVGLNIGIVVLSGAIISWHFAIPIYHMLYAATDPALAGLGAEEAAGTIWSTKIRYLGVGAMLIGGVWTLFSLRKSLLSGVKSGIAAARAGRSPGDPWDVEVSGEQIRTVAALSRDELAMREARDCDVGISDVLGELGVDAAHTINHPGNPVLIALAQRILDHLGATVTTGPVETVLLSSVSAPLEARVLDALGLVGTPRAAWCQHGATIAAGEVHTGQLRWYERNRDFLELAVQRHGNVMESLGLLTGPRFV